MIIESTNNSINHSTGSNDVKKIIVRLLKNWYWFAVILILSIAGAYFYVKVTPTLYQISSTVLVGEGNNHSPLTAIYGPGMVQDNSIYQVLYNQIAILSSSPLIARTLSKLDFEVSYFRKERFADIDLYKDSPFQVLWDNNHPQIIEQDFFLTIHPDKTISINIEAENIQLYNYFEKKELDIISEFSFQNDIQLNTKVETEYFSFIVVMEDIQSINPGEYKFRFHTPATLTKKYRSMLTVEMSADYASILNLSIQEHNIQKGIDFLSEHTKVFLDDNLEKKNKNAELTIQFIDSQLQNISDSLNISENRLATFRSNNQMIDLPTQSQQLLTQINLLDNEIIRHKNQNKYYTYLKEYIETNKDTETVIAPSTVGIDDPLLNNFILQLNTLINEKTSQTSIRPNSDHPVFVQLNTQIEIVKNSLRQSINNIIKQSDTELESLNQRMREYNDQIRRLPATERNFVNFERKYRIDNETYTFLLQKLSESRIAKASNVSDGQYLESPFVSAIVHPQPQRIYTMAILLALILPATIILILDLLNTKILHKKDIIEITNYPVIGQIIQVNGNKSISTPVLNNPNSPISNAYVSIRSKLNLLAKGKKNPVIAVTSAWPNEGKTFNAINIASSIALTRKSVILLDLDLRNSKVAEVFELGKVKGVVDYIIGRASLDTITYDTILPRLKVIPAGSIPPNPSEMLSDERLHELIKKLKEYFDIIVIDTPPLGIVSDLLQINEFIDSNILVVRYKTSKKEALKSLLEEVSRHQMKGVGIIFNGIKQNEASYAGGYGYKYQYGNNKKSTLQRDVLTLEEVAEALEVNNNVEEKV